MTKKNLTEDELQLEKEIEQGDWVSAGSDLNQKVLKAAQTSTKAARVSLRLDPNDVAKIRRKAEREGLPYQTLIASVLHKYATDQFIDEDALEKVMQKIRKKAG